MLTNQKEKGDMNFIFEKNRGTQKEMLTTGIEPVTPALLAPCSNQLS